MKRKLFDDSLRLNVASFGALFFFVITLWSIGLLDCMFEVDFAQFRWPPYVNVRHQVIREILGEPSEFLYYNDWTNFRVLISPNCQQHRLTRKRSLLIIVKSAPHRLANRNAVRSTWGSVKQHENYKIRTIFVMGDLDDESRFRVGDTLQAEAKEHGDLLVGDFIDNYRNNTMKFVHSLRFAKEYCSGLPVPYVFLVDDDYLVSIKNLVGEIDKHPPNERLYMGWRFDTSPFRLIFHKHRVSLKEYPFSAYPPYISAGAVLLTSQTVKEMYLAVQHLKLYPYDDVYAGIIAYCLGIIPQHNENFHFWSTSLEDISMVKAIAVHGYNSMDLIENYKRVL
uniref:Hexosyltransferase n=1 Tax=Acrobeloides nanus TaxID=290746 RepID=A0A914E222_9BILA